MEQKAAARIGCMDLDCFFVSVERLIDPTLVGKPVIVGHAGGRGVVTSASYEVRPLGVKSGMPMSQALRLAPDAIVTSSGFGEYSSYSARVMALVGEICPQVQPASIDEAYLDFTGCERLYAKPTDADADATVQRVVRELRQRIQDELGLPASVGLGTTRSIAKIASGFAKPAGVHQVRAGDERSFVDLLSVRAWPGIGPVTGGKLQAEGIHTLGQLVALADRPDEAEEYFGARVGELRLRFGELAARVAQGTDGTRPQASRRHRPAFQEHDPEGGDLGSLSNERTFHADVGDDRAVEDQLRALAERVCWRVRKRGILARTIGLKLRYSDFHTITRSVTRDPTNTEAVVLDAVVKLYRRARTRKLPIRLVGVQLSNLVRPPPQLALPLGEEPKVATAIDEVRARFGYDAIRLGAAGSRSSWLA